MLPKIEKITGKEGVDIYQNQILNVKDTELSDGSVGTLNVEIAPSREKLPAVSELENREEVMKHNGVNGKAIAITFDWLDDWELDVEILPESIAADDRIKQEAEFESRMNTMAIFFPEYVASNKEKLFKEFIAIYGQQIDEYQKPQPKPQLPGIGGEEMPAPLPGDFALEDNQQINEPV